ncbi:MAG: hypothetical protein V4858_26925 [Pseudomonadota bacterium]
MSSILKTPLNTGKATAAAVAATVVACGVCCLPLVTPLALGLLASLGVYSVSDVLTHGWWLAAAALLVLSPLLVWRWRKHRQVSAPPACATDCNCKTAGNAQ